MGMKKSARTPFIFVPLMFLLPATVAASDSAANVDGRSAVDVQALRSVVAARLPQVTRCYERELKRQPGLHGRLEVRFTIGADGDVIWSEVVRDTVGSNQLARCVAAQFRTFRFAALGDGREVTVAYPLVFKRGEGTGRAAL